MLWLPVEWSSSASARARGGVYLTGSNRWGYTAWFTKDDPAFKDARDVSNIKLIFKELHDSSKSLFPFSLEFHSGTSAGSVSEHMVSYKTQASCRSEPGCGVWLLYGPNDSK